MYMQTKTNKTIVPEIFSPVDYFLMALLYLWRLLCYVTDLGKNNHDPDLETAVSALVADFLVVNACLVTKESCNLLRRAWCVCLSACGSHFCSLLNYSLDFFFSVRTFVLGNLVYCKCCWLKTVLESIWKILTWQHRDIGNLIISVLLIDFGKSGSGKALKALGDQIWSVTEL